MLKFIRNNEEILVAILPAVVILAVGAIAFTLDFRHGHEWLFANKTLPQAARQLVALILK